MKNTTSVLSAFNFRQLPVIQEAILVRQCLKLSKAATAWSLNENTSCVSSAYEINLTPQCSTTDAKGVRSALNRVGLNAEPWGTPHSRGLEEETCGRKKTRWVRAHRKEKNQAKAVPVIPSCASLSNRIGWNTVSKAADKSSSTSMAQLPSSRDSQMVSATSNRAVSVLYPVLKPD